MRMHDRDEDRGQSLDIAVVGSGISGLSAAWLLSQRHRVTLFEAENRLGGHSNTVDASGVPVDTGFIVYNEATYPNLTALFGHLGVATKPSDMSFAVSLDDGRLEYSGTGLRGPVRAAPQLRQPALLDDAARPRALLSRGAARRRQRSARSRSTPISTPPATARRSATIISTRWRRRSGRRRRREIGDYPAAAFIRFCENHGLLKLSGRPVWRTVEGGSRSYVAGARRGHPGRSSRTTPISDDLARRRAASRSPAATAIAGASTRS